MFNEYDTDKSGTINIDEFETLMVKLGVAPLKDPNKKSSASSDKNKDE
jgi:Ca2+-binding EF-hand superfamily protein